MRHFLIAMSMVILGLPSLWAGTLKIISKDNSPEAANASLIADYGSYKLYRINEDDYQALDQNRRSKLRVVAMNQLKFTNHPIDTRLGLPAIPDHMKMGKIEDKTLSLIQFVGPIKEAWLNRIRATGAEPIHYIADNGYLVWAGETARKDMEAMVLRGDILQFAQVHQPYFKLDPILFERQTNRAAPRAEIKITIQMLNHAQKSETMDLISAMALETFSSWSPILNYQNIIISIDEALVPTLAARPDVVWIGERLPRELYDEVQDQILAGDFDGTMAGPNSPGYLAFLDSLGFPSNPAEYAIVDITDDGIGNGNVLSTDPTLHELGDIGNPSRLQFVQSCTSNASGQSDGGHGHINTNIVGGYDTRTGAPFQDDDGFNLGLGVSPYGRLAGTRIFSPGFDLSNCGGTDTGLIQASYQAGGRISSNSWGCSGCAGSYDDSSQAFDVGVRDADLDAPGNQELMIVFAAGNSGPGGGTVGTPGNGKNMLTVGASENDRPTWSDGCAIGPTGADNAMDVISFSSRGPSPGNRTKPEIIAPGTHIQGTASTSPSYNGSSVCDQFHPPGQTTFAASSGTSHSCPAISGITQLAYWWLQNEIPPLAFAGSYEPSPSTLKAFVISHANTYLTGVGANDTLPSQSQGYGMPDISVAFDDAQRFVLDQSVLFDDSGDTHSVSGSVSDPGLPFRVALVYTDQAGAIGSSPQVNDLNLEVEVDGTTYLGNDFNGQWSTTGGSADPDNNYEAVFLPPGTTGSVEIRVNGFNIAGDGVPGVGDATDQDFSIVAYNFAQFPDFSLRAAPGDISICAPADAVYDLDILQILGFTDPVTLSVSGEPAGTTATLGETMVTPPAMTTLTITNTGAAAAGTYTITVSGTSTTGTKDREVQLTIYDAVPGVPAPMSPANGALEVTRFGLPLGWNGSSQAADYTVELATDMAFANIIHTATTTGTTTTSPTLDSLTTYYWRVRADNTCGTSANSDIFSFTTLEQPDYFTEAFTTNNDLDLITLKFIPDGTGDYYRGCTEVIAGFPTDPTGGTELVLTDDDFEEVTPSQSVPFYGTDHSSFFVGGNGYVTFTAGDTDFSETLADHFDLPRISVMFDDMAPHQGGTISWKEEADRIAVTWDGVPEYTNLPPVFFQIEMFFNGEVHLSYLELQVNDGLVGLSQGNGVPPDYIGSDVSNMGTNCAACFGDFDASGTVDVGDLLIAVAGWRGGGQDVNSDGVVDVRDLVTIRSAYGACTR